jgi:hypothetical protein
MAVSHDGRGRALDNVMVERLCRSVKYEDIYLRDYLNPEHLDGEKVHLSSAGQALHAWTNV